MSNSKSNNRKKTTQSHRDIWKSFIKLFPKCHLPWIWVIMYIVIDVVGVNIGIGETDYTARLFAGDTSVALVTKLIAIMIINILCSNLVVFVGSITSARINRNMRNVILDKVMKLPMSYFKDEEPREAIYRIVENATVIDSTLMLVLMPLFTALYTAVSVWGRVLKYDIRLSIILIGFIPVQILIAFIFGRINYKLSKQETDANVMLTGKLAELVTHIPLAKAFAKEEVELEKGQNITALLYKINIKTSWTSQFKDLSETIVSLVQSLIIVLVGVILLRNQDISTRTWIAFFLFSSVFSDAVNNFMIYWNNMKIIQGGATGVAEIMDAEEEDYSGELCTELRGDIELSDMSFGYEEDKQVLKHLNCSFKDNAITALLGPSGCGKTTLVNLIMRLYKADSGDIKAGGRSIYEYGLESYRDQFVMVSQSSMLFSGSIRENICYGCNNVSEEQIISALKKAGAYDFVMNMEAGIDSDLEEYGSNLSGGQRQRLAMARALVSDAHYMILDEPSASMDAIATAELYELLQEISTDKCLIIIAHSPAVLDMAQRVVIIEDGSISAQGDIARVMETNDFLAGFAGRR